MSNARELALIEKWADIAQIPTTTSVTLPPLSSPTSPKATTFCCCPNRRRYNLKGSSSSSAAHKKSTLHARNIFVDNDFKYIDDVSLEHDSCGKSSVSVSSNSSSPQLNRRNNKRRTRNEQTAAATVGETTNLAALEDYYSDYDDIMQVAGNNTNTYNNKEQLNNSNTCAESSRLLNQQETLTNAHLQHNNNDKVIEQQQQLQQQNINKSNNCFAHAHSPTTNISKPNIGAVTNTISNAECLTAYEQQMHLQHNNKYNEQLQQSQQQQQQLDEVTIQRLSYSETSNKPTTTTPPPPTTTPATATNDCNCCCNDKENNCTCRTCKQRSDWGNCQREKMTIATTTNVITNRKRSDCGLTTQAQAATSSVTGITAEPSLPVAATTATKASHLTLPLATTSAGATRMPQSPTTPTKTVIKTVLVKRSPINETNDMAATTTTTVEPVPMRRASAQRTWENPAAGSEQPRYSVKDRIAAFVAGNEQNQQKHDNSIKYKIQCNKNTNANMTNSTKSAIKTTSSQQQELTTTTTAAAAAKAATNQLLISNNKCTTSATTTAEKTTEMATATATPTAAATTLSTTTGNSIATSTGTSAQSNVASSTSNNNNNKLLQLNDDDIKLQRQMLLGNNTGCATLPRCRASNERYSSSCGHNSNNSTNSNSCSNNNKYGSNVAKTMTAFDKNFPSQNGDKNVSANDVVLHATTASNNNASNNNNNGSQSGKLSALDNLDLALSLELTDDDGEDPYYALQEYLEKVKHEINEVFELHKARQRMEKEEAHAHPQHDDDDLLSDNTDAMAVKTVADNAAAEQIEMSSSSTSHAAAATTLSSDELSRSIDSDSGFDSASATGQLLNSSHNGSINSSIIKLPTSDRASPSAPISDETGGKPVTSTELRALPPPPLRDSEDLHNWPTAKRMHAAQHSSDTSDEVHMWANKFLKDLDSLMSPKATASASSSPTTKTSPMLLSAAASAAIKSRYGAQRGATVSGQEQTNALVLRPEKHTTIPLQSFNLDCGRIDSSCANASASAAAVGGGGAVAGTNKATIGYMRTLSAPNPYQQQMADSKSGYAAAAAGGAGAGATHGKGNRNSLAAFNVVAEKQPAQRERHNQTHNSEQCLTNAESNEVATVTPTTATTILKIEETSAAPACNDELLETRRQRQLENDMETIRNALLQQTQQLSAMEAEAMAEAEAEAAAAHNMHSSGTATMATSQPKRERINHATNAGKNLLTADATTALTPAAGNGNGYLLASNDPMTKKGSTSTIWTSEESILRSVGAVDEDNNSTSSSACDEATGVLSSGKSGISLDSSGLDNDNNESGIGTATPPKDMFYWKTMHHHHQHQHNDNESVSSLDALRKMKFQKSSSVASSDDPDLLEVLSLCGEPSAAADNDDLGEGTQKQKQKKPLTGRQHDSSETLELLDDMPATANAEEHANDADEDDEGHDEFETIPYCDCDCTDGDVSSTSGNSSSHKRTLPVEHAKPPTTTTVTGVVLRRKCNATAAAPIMVPYATQKCRSHSLDTASLPTAYHYHQHHHHHHPLTRKLQHLQHGRAKERVQLSLALRQEPFQSLLAPTHFHELPSPSSASLHSGHESIGIQELTTKSNSAPLLLKQEKKRDDFAGQKLTLRYSRSQSDRYLAEIEAVEACKWLRAAGFPQYAQMYEDHQFPIDLTNVAKDHTNLENDQLQSLYRRLCILNRCANMRLDQSHKPQTPQQKEDSDDENFALSENWTFQPHIRRWSRIGEMGLELPPATKLNVEKTESSSKESSPDRFEDDDDDQYDLTGAGLSLILPTAAAVGVAGAGGVLTGEAADAPLNESAEAAAVRLRRTGSERLKDGAKALLRRVESIKSRRRKRQNREGIVISGPQALDLSQLGQRHSARKPDAVYSTPPSPSAVSPMHTFPKSPFFSNELKVPSQSDNYLHPNRASPKRTPTTPRSMRTSPLHFFQMPHLKEGKSDDSSSYYSDSQESSTGGKLTLRKPTSKARRFLQRSGKVDDIGTHSDSECHQGRKLLIKDANANNTEVTVKKLQRGGSLNLGKDPKKREGFRSSSFRSRSTTRKETKTDETEGVKRSPVVRWHSFQMEERPHMIFRKCFSQKLNPNCNEHGVPFAAMSAGQLQIIRKLALVILTGYMERYCPTHRSGWNWELPKFIKKIKMPDYRDKKVFGVPLLLILQRTGQTLPIAVRSAFRWLQLNALDQIGLFRKSGVKSRIIKLKELIEYSESTAECMDVFDTQQAYDVADMLKQYFRDLPESLLTTKMSETFAAIFQHLPPEVRLDAVQCAVLLLPDENREILYALLEFLTLVAANSSYNQMTTNNLAVCLAPSLFHSSISTGSASVSASPRRRGKGTGVPDAKELSEAKASHECLSFMIDHYKQIYTASKERLSKCNFGYMEESKPVPLEALGEGMHFHNWRGYLYECTSATIKEGREKTRGWFTITSPNDPQVEIAYKKVGDGHPLRLWRCITEIEGPPKEVLDYIIRQRASWDVNLLQCQTVKKLDERTEIFQYALDGQFTTDFCVLRSWQTDLPRGACVIVETSIDHAKAKPMFGAVRGVVLASRYLIEPCGSGRSRVMHLARVDIKGKTPEWYNKSYGHICSHYLSKIRLAFKNVADGPESKV